MTQRTNFGERIRAAREAIGLSQLEAALKAKVDFSYWIAIENNDSFCRPLYDYTRLLKDITGAVGLTVDDVI